MSNVLPAFWENLHAKPGEPAPSRPFPSYALNASHPGLFLLVFFTLPLAISTNANTLILVSEFSRPFFSLVAFFVVLTEKEEDQVLHTDAFAFQKGIACV